MYTMYEAFRIQSDEVSARLSTLCKYSSCHVVELFPFQY